ncbi:hypothetical protein [Amylibacter sp. IMCC11727]|uniref:hypothetical protein n=1 Tax=Amylibacter sp. IMCC11727 TaxID=3039851 RepID=UPI00244E2F54|nr:hypothetical protein [Amylibacter sp. IMCC11727]WGI23614.1 hypothetical protein QBD29_02375 [Amylibacter sp. IMCC11727]
MQATKKGHAEHTNPGPNSGLGKEFAFGIEFGLLAQLREQECRENEKHGDEKDFTRFGFDGARGHHVPRKVVGIKMADLSAEIGQRSK